MSTRQIVERCTGDHAHVAIQLICTDNCAYMVITTNDADTLQVATHALADARVTHIVGGDHEVSLN